MPIPNPNTTSYYPKSPTAQQPEDYGNVFFEDDLDRILAKIDPPVVSDRVTTGVPSPVEPVVSTDGQPVVNQTVKEEPVTKGENGAVGTTAGTEIGAVSVPQTYKYNWDQAVKDGRLFREVVRDKDKKYWNDKESNLNWAEIYSDYNRWAKANNRDPLDLFEWQAAMGEDNVAKSPEDNEKERKRQKWEDAMEQAGYLLANLGNFVGSIGGSVPGSGKDSPDSEALTRRQQLLRDATKKERSAYNKYLIEQLYKSQSDRRTEELKKKEQELAERRIARQEEETRLRAAKNEAYINYQNSLASKNVEQAAYWKAKADALEQGQPLDKALKAARTAQAQAAARLSNTKADNEASGKTVTTTTGGETKVVTTKPAKAVSAKGKSLGIGLGSKGKSLGIGLGK